MDADWTALEDATAEIRALDETQTRHSAKSEDEFSFEPQCYRAAAKREECEFRLTMVMSAQRTDDGHCGPEKAVGADGGGGSPFRMRTAIENYGRVGSITCCIVLVGRPRKEYVHTETEDKPPHTHTRRIRKLGGLADRTGEVPAHTEDTHTHTHCRNKTESRVPERHTHAHTRKPNSLRFCCLFGCF